MKKYWLSICLGIVSIGLISCSNISKKTDDSTQELKYTEQKNQELVETDTNVNERIELINFDIPTSIPVDEVNVEYSEMENGKKAVVTNKKNNKVIAIYSETISEEVEQDNEKQWRSHLELSYVYNPVTISIFTDILMTKKNDEQSQMMGIPYIHQEASSWDEFEIKNPNEDIREPIDFPADYAILNITGQIYSTSQMNKETGLSYETFKTARYDMSGTRKSDWVAMKNYNFQVVLKKKYS
ncbi:hypothetical protein ACYSNW_02510 [Enterococcus sp. LJL99]